MCVLSPCGWIEVFSTDGTQAMRHISYFRFQVCRYEVPPFGRSSSFRTPTMSAHLDFAVFVDVIRRSGLPARMLASDEKTVGHKYPSVRIDRMNTHQELLK